jgi:hypothetical protein
MEETKVCCLCKEEKAIELFVAKRTQCKKCHSERSQKWRDDNLSLNRAVQRAHYYKRKSIALQQK